MKTLTQQLNESLLNEAKRTGVNILVGRFQPFTLGHLKCIQHIYKTRGIKTVLCMIETTKTDDKKPFLTKVLMPYYRRLVKAYEEIEGIILVKNADIVKIGEELGALGLTAATWTCGTDRYESYSKMVQKYAPSVEVVEIKREDSDVSATEVRQTLKADHKERFEELVPQVLYNMYDKLKDIIQAY